MRQAFLLAFLFAVVIVSGCAHYGCGDFGPPPETVPFVDIERYVGLWHEIASNPVFFNRDLVGVTAEYALLDNNRVSVLNTGYRGEINESNKTTISGVARVVDTKTNAKLEVQFDRFLGCLFRGNYWIVLLDEEDYQYAVVSDDRQFTLFILCRSPEMDAEVYQEILDALEDKGVDTSRLRETGVIN